MVKVLRYPDYDRYGEFFVMPVADVFGKTGENANKYALMAEDWYVCNCNGDREYVPIIAGDSPEEVWLWAAAGGFTVRESPPARSAPRFSIPRRRIRNGGSRKS